jgi:hypothetical protein
MPSAKHPSAATFLLMKDLLAYALSSDLAFFTRQWIRSRSLGPSSLQSESMDSDITEATEATLLVPRSEAARNLKELEVLVDPK